MMSGDETADEPAQAPGEHADSADSDPEEPAPEAPATDDVEDEQPAIDDDQQAVIPDDIDVSGEDIEDETAEDADSDQDEQSEESSAAPSMEADSSASPVQAGELYVTVVQQTTNAIIRSRGDGVEVSRDHFEQYDLAHYFNETMEEAGVGSDLEPHEALVLATALSVGEPVLTETDVMDDQIGRLMDKAMGNGGAEA